MRRAALLATLALAACQQQPQQSSENVVIALPEANAAAPPPEPAAPEVGNDVTNEAMPPANTTAPAERTIASNAIPERFRGVYDQNAAGCRARSSVFRLRINASELRFHESLGEVKTVTADGSDAIRVASNYSGEGMEWSTSQRLSLANDGARLTVAGEGAPITRVRC